MAFAVNWGLDEDLMAYHKKMTMEMFIKLVKDRRTCRNFLDGKEMNPGTLKWVKSLLNSTITWEHMMHLRFLQEAKPKKNPAV